MVLLQTSFVNFLKNVHVGVKMFFYLFDFVFIFTEPTLPNHDLFCLHATRHFVSLKRFVRSDHQSGAKYTFNMERNLQYFLVIPNSSTIEGSIVVCSM